MGDKLPTRVLIVDDDPVVLETLSAWLKAAGFAVRTRERPIGTTNDLLRDPPDCLLLDIGMPGLSGDSLANLIRSNRALAHISLIFFSSLPQEQLDAAVARTGALGAIRKTANGREVVESLRRLLARSST